MDPDELPPRIRSKVFVTDDGCWMWTAALTKDGYGRAHWRGAHPVAHRLVFHLLADPSLTLSDPDRATPLDHLCRVRSCVNPAHLEVVSHRTNTLRGEGPAGRNARKTECPRGHPYNGDNLYVWRNARKCRECNRELVARRRQSGVRT